MKQCWICGKDGVHTISKQVGFTIDEQPLARWYCAEHFKEKTKELQDIKKTYVTLKKKLMFERAVRMLERQGVDMYEYKDIVDQIEEYVAENPEKFDSSHEIVAAIMLVSSEIKCMTHYKIGKYEADFLLPSLKIVLEIDGDRHTDYYKDNGRDIEIRRMLGKEWEVVRIGTKYLEQNAELLLSATTSVKAEKQKLRSEYNGLLPDWYSNREFAKRKRKPKIGDDALLEL